MQCFIHLVAFLFPLEHVGKMIFSCALFETRGCSLAYDDVTPVFIVTGETICCISLVPFLPYFMELKQVIGA
jgi:hypothetical protein